MKYEINSYKLGQLLKITCDKYETTLMIKATLSGGWMTMYGDVQIGAAPTSALSFKGNNVIDIKIKTEEKEMATIKITASKKPIFNVSIAATRFREISHGVMSNEIQINDNECKIKIDEDMIFTVKAKKEEVEQILSEIK